MAKEMLQSELSIHDLEWMLSADTELFQGGNQPYGDLTALNNDGLIKRATDPAMLGNIAADFLSLLGTSSAIYEKNGDYAFGIFSSGWCQCLDAASFSLCDSDDLNQALPNGKWLCHVSCWTDASKICIARNEPVDIECQGGIRLYAIPIHDEGEVIGAISFGYGTPPKEESRLREIADKFAVPYEYLVKKAEEYRPRPAFIVEVAKKRLQFAASLIGTLVERHKTQGKLLESEERYRTLNRSMTQPMALHEIICDAAGTPVDYRFLDVNPAFEKLLEKDSEEIVGKTVKELLPDIETFWIETYGKVALTGVPAHFENYSQTLGRHFDVVAYSPRIGQFAVIATDISERAQVQENKRRMEEQMFHAQKLESLGVLAGGIAHDFNNILMSVLGNANLALKRLSTESPAVNNIRQIEIAASKAADLSRQMLAYSGKGRFAIEPLIINKLIQEMIHILQVSISKQAVLRFNYHSDLPAVEVDATQMHQVIMNLVINASEAIGEKSGVISISTGEMDCDRSYLRSACLDEELPEGLYVYYEVADTGCGMDRHTLNHLFDPFFSTKFTGRGLGMAAVLGIVRGHKGAIKVYSELGKGTTFKVLLPASTKPETLYDSREKDINWNGSGTVLLVDDEETVRAIGKDMLQELGFDVLSASDGREALRLFAEHSKIISYVLMDLTMPHMDGEEAFRELRRMDPTVKIIMTSGYNEQEVNHKFPGKGLSGFIQKPYRLSELVKVFQTFRERSCD